MELILTWVIKAEHTGALPGNPSFAWIKKKNFNKKFALAPGSQFPEGVLSYYSCREKFSFFCLEGCPAHLLLFFFM